ncbi:hypothetical protein SDRG_14511 [Saprolegnia diclina VS20]|uniref:Uncharacterized protein n=1 Tax=Saprolegnia diclina (strain VS20) TaxID=1156394 RepID=T0RDS0_SAPDV|nr:hypothetical protein SDRG_14511 [Saprolegnia diclina VS20]EQC27762.1 hypothetical protein SDRG_14511 [Saprolegnia diclina VS20]|eukprot:XP_008618867.1 hypothetical protein SDRG_14511 [Saprolegnia diclina VS20]
MPRLDDDDDGDAWNEVDLRKVAKQEMLDAETSGCLRLTKLHLVRMPRSLQYLPHLQIIDLSQNGLTRLPGQWLRRSFPTLHTLHIGGNQLHVMDDVLHLSRMHHLRDLDISSNPLPLVTNRVYLLEALFQAPTPRDATYAIETDLQAACIVPDKTRCPAVYRARTLAPVPRREGFPMLQVLNQAPIVLDDVAAVERELGRKLRYPAPHTTTASVAAASRPPARFLEMRKTAKELERRKLGFKTLPAVRSVPRLQYTVDRLPEPVSAYDDLHDVGRGQDGGMTRAECEMARRDIKLGLAVTGPATGGELPPAHEPVLAAGHWNHSIASLDDLQNDQRCVVREKSKSDSTLQDDPLESDVLLDSMVQAERSRRLTQRTLDVLANVDEATDASDPFSTSCGDALLDRLNHNYTPAIVADKFKVTTAFCKRIFAVGSKLVTPDFRDIIELELQDTRHRNTTLLSTTDPAPPSLVATMDLSLNRLRAQNRIEGVINTINPKHEKRLIQALIDSDQQVVDEQLRRQKIKEHKDRMDNIAHRGHRTRPTSATPARHASSWQQRNITAMTMKEKGVVPRSTARISAEPKHLAYRTIETVEAAADDHLLGVSSKELLLRCAEIRKHARESLKELAKAKTDFVVSECEWESRRRDRIELLKRKVRASACDGTEIMIGDQEFIYASF